MLVNRDIAEIDIWRSTKLLVDQHGADAAIRAAQRADELLAAGDIEGRAATRRGMKRLARWAIAPPVLALLRVGFPNPDFTVDGPDRVFHRADLPAADAPDSTARTEPIGAGEAVLAALGVRARRLCAPDEVGLHDGLSAEV